MACAVMIFIEKFSNFRKVFHFILFHLIFWIYLTTPPLSRKGGFFSRYNRGGEIVKEIQFFYAVYAITAP